MLEDFVTNTGEALLRYSKWSSRRGRKARVLS
jgi:hypothetical protein